MLVIIGKSVEWRPIEAYVRGNVPERTVLIVGGVHGDEPKSVFIARRLIELLDTEHAAGADTRWVIVPVINPDGYERRKRRNAHKIDINRNFPTDSWTRLSKRSRMYGGSKPASEPETRAAITAVERYRPAAIIAIHSIGDRRYCNNYDGSGEAMAAIMQSHNAYPVTSSIGYSTPGSFGTWAGIERNIPIITLELPSHDSPKRCWEDNRPALLACGEVLATQHKAQSVLQC